MRKTAHVDTTVPAEFNISNPAGTSVIEVKVIAGDAKTAAPLSKTMADYLSTKKYAAGNNTRSSVHVIEYAAAISVR